MHISYHYHLADTIFLYSHWLPPYFLWYHRFRIIYINLVILFLRSCIFKLYHPFTFISIYSTFTLYFSHSRVVPSRSLYCLIVSAIRFAAAPVVELPGICAARRSRDTRIYHLADTTPYHQADTLYLFFTLTPYLFPDFFLFASRFHTRFLRSCILAWCLNIPLS